MAPGTATWTPTTRETFTSSFSLGRRRQGKATPYQHQKNNGYGTGNCGLREDPPEATQKGKKLHLHFSASFVEIFTIFNQKF